MTHSQRQAQIEFLAKQIRDQHRRPPAFIEAFLVRNAKKRDFQRFEGTPITGFGAFTDFGSL